MNTTTAGAGYATVAGQPRAGQLRRSGDDKMLAAGTASAKPAPSST